MNQPPACASCAPSSVIHYSPTPSRGVGIHSPTAHVAPLDVYWPTSLDARIAVSQTFPPKGLGSALGEAGSLGVA